MGDHSGFSVGDPAGTTCSWARNALHSPRRLSRAPHTLSRERESGKCQRGRLTSHRLTSHRLILTHLASLSQIAALGNSAWRPPAIRTRGGHMSAAPAGHAPSAPAIRTHRRAPVRPTGAGVPPFRGWIGLRVRARERKRMRQTKRGRKKDIETATEKQTKRDKYRQFDRQ